MREKISHYRYIFVHAFEVINFAVGLMDERKILIFALTSPSRFKVYVTARGELYHCWYWNTSAK